MDISKKFGTDADLESGTGITLDFGGGATVTIHRAGGTNAKFMRAAAKRRARLNAAKNDLDASLRVLAEVYAEAIVLGWTGIELDGKAVPYSKENVIAAFVAVPEFFNMIRQEAEEAGNFRDGEREADAGN
jgi:hypothetical protein